MQTALHIYALVRELGDTITGGKFIASEFYKKEREAYIHFKTSKGVFAVGLAYHPAGYGAFVIPRSKIIVKTKEKPWPFFQSVLGADVKSVEQIGLDRIIKIRLGNDTETFSVIIEAIGPNGNLWLLDSDDKIAATLRNKAYDRELPYAPPPPLVRLNPFAFDKDEFNSLIKKSPVELGNFLNKSILGLDRITADEIADRAGFDPDLTVGEMTDEDIAKLADSIKATAGLFERYSPGYSHDNPATAPFKMHHLSGEWKKYKTLSLAVYDLIKSRKASGAEQSGKQKILDAVARHVKRIRRKIDRVEKDIATAGKYDQYRRYAETLTANLSGLKRGVESVELDDLYDDGGDKITIKLDPALAPSENAELYFKKYRKGKDALALLTRRLEIAGKELRAAEAMQEEFESDFEAAQKKYESEITEILPAAVSKRTEAPHLPYRLFTLPSGVTIYVGKDGTDNDTTTFRHARSYELWFHASQCPGSHVVLKFPDKNFQPSKNEIAETAAAAAFYSKAKNSKTVPVIYAERKYVRKPRGAKPGLVTVEREKMVMVEPKKPE